MSTYRSSFMVGVLFALCALIYSSAASANHNVSFRIGVFFSSPYYGPYVDAYVIDDYNSGYWYAWDEPLRYGYWNAQYGGYDCHPAFMFGYRGWHRARYEAVICYDEFGDYFVVRNSWHELAYFNSGFWIDFGGHRWHDHHWDWAGIRTRDRYRWRKHRHAHKGHHGHHAYQGHRGHQGHQGHKGQRAYQGQREHRQDWSRQHHKKYQHQQHNQAKHYRQQDQRGGYKGQRGQQRQFSPPQKHQYQKPTQPRQFKAQQNARQGNSGPGRHRSEPRAQGNFKGNVGPRQNQQRYNNPQRASKQRHHQWRDGERTRGHGKKASNAQRQQNFRNHQYGDRRSFHDRGHRSKKERKKDRGPR